MARTGAGLFDTGGQLTSDRESDITPRPVVVTSARGTVTSVARDVDAHHEWAVWLAAFAALVLSFDLFWMTLGRRKVVPPSVVPPQAARAGTGVRT